MTQGPYRLLQLAGSQEYEAGSLLYHRGGVRPLTQEDASLRYVVAGTPRREVILRADGPAQCSCEAHQAQGACRHVVAATLMAQETGALAELRRRRAVTGAPVLWNAMESALPEAGTLRMEITLLYEARDLLSPELRIGVRAGEDRLYVVRSLPQFLEAIAAKTPLSFGKGFVFQPEWMRFAPKEMRVLDIIQSLCQAHKSVGAVQHGMEARTMRLPQPFAKQVLHELSGLPFRLAVNGVAHHIGRVQDGTVPVHYLVSLNGRGLGVAARFAKDVLPLTEDCSYVWLNGQVLRVDKAQRGVLRVLIAQQFEGLAEFEYPLKDGARVISELVPWLQLTGGVELDGDFKKRIVHMPLHTKLYLDREGPEVVARTVFQYGDMEVDPFQAEDGTAGGAAEGAARGTAEEMAGGTAGGTAGDARRAAKLLMRDAAGERAVLDGLANAGFHVRKGRVYLSGQEAIFQFVSKGVSDLTNICEVFASQDFKKMTPRRPLMKGRMSVKGSRLELEFTESGVPVQELMPILEALHQRRRYFRLKDGSFLDLSGMEDWEAAADALVESARQEGVDFASAGSKLSLNGYRTLYLNSLLAERGLPIEQDQSVDETVSALISPAVDSGCPDPLGGMLRPYQQRGFAWLKALHQMRMGGILADDMGLGKTIQVIAMLLWAKENQGRQASIVVAPTSLTYNWQAELKRFAPRLSVLVLSGSQSNRASQIAYLKNAKDVDVLVTSYPLIRRDIEKLEDVSFRFAILDEAQHIKNAASVGAAAVKQLKAETRFALTGTPMENNAGELWSLFDFVLPGYLNTYTQFIRDYGEGKNSQELRRKIRPFLMRRLKKEVLTELPDKLETTLLAQMPQDQERVYQAALMRLRDRVDDLLRTKGIHKGRTEVLAAITELRQICCHPALCLKDYSGASGKLDLLLEILPGAIEAGRRILLFSQFTSMLKILRRHLEAEGYACMYLDGETPASKRLDMTAAFNEGKGQIFLISLKAGGTGLNLTGADMVIHYDPWWNPAAEDQATDRAHRIGQTRKVEVVRLITHQSIEEQVTRLGKKKRQLFDQLITAGEEMPNQLSENDIRALFA